MVSIMQNLRALLLLSLIVLNNTNVLAQTYIFVSFSMPDEALKSYYAEAQKVGAILVMRGLVNNSFLETKAKVDKMAISFNIDPNLFEQYQIKQVPVIIIDDGQGFVKKLTGHVPCSKALEMMEHRPQLSKVTTHFISQRHCERSEAIQKDNYKQIDVSGLLRRLIAASQ